MRRSVFTAALAFVLPALAAQAQSDHPGMKPEDGGQMEKGVSQEGIARDPGGVRAQQGDSAKASPGTVGAAPGAATPSQKQ